jgi:hypothetical protein
MVMENRIRKNRHLLPRAALIVLTVMAWGGCEWFLGPELDTPKELTATTTLTDEIQLNWLQVDKADIYYIYRAESEEGPYDYYTFAYTSAYTDTGIAPAIPYWYQVTASDLESNNESDPTEGVMGNSTHEFGWSDATAAGTGAAQQRLALDRADSSTTGMAYLATVANDSTGEITVYTYDFSGGSWETLGNPFGTTDNAVTRVADIAAHNGTVYVAYADKGLSGKVSVRKYNASTEAWDVVGSEGFSTGTDAAYISMDVDDSGKVYLGYIDDSGFYMRDDGNYTDPGTNLFTESNSSTSAVTSVYGTTYNYAFEDSVAGTVKANVASPVTTGNLRDNYMDFIAVSATEMYIAYYTDAFYVKKYDGSDWTTNITPASITVSASAASVALSYDSSTGTLYLFYRDPGEGIVLKYSGNGTTWETVSDGESEGIATNPSNLELETYNNYLYASYLQFGIAQMRIRE